MSSKFSKISLNLYKIIFFGEGKLFLMLKQCLNDIALTDVYKRFLIFISIQLIVL